MRLKFIIIIAIILLIFFIIDWRNHLYIDNLKSRFFKNKEHPSQATFKRSLIHYQICKKYIEEGNLNKAEFECKKAIKINPSFAKAYMNLGVVYYKRGEFKLAEEEFKKALKNIGKDIYNKAIIYYNLGTVYKNLKDLDKSWECFKKSYQLKSEVLEKHGSGWLVDALKDNNKEKFKWILKPTVSVISLDSWQACKEYKKYKEDNAAFWYQKAFIKMYSLIGRNALEIKFERLDKVIREGWDSSLEREIIVLLNKMKPVIELFEKGTSLEKCDFKFSLEDPPPFTPFFHLAKLVILKGRYYQKEKDLKDAIDIYLKLLRYTRHLSREKKLGEVVASLVIIRDLLFPALKEFAENKDLNESSYQRLLSFLDDLERGLNLKKALERELKLLEESTFRAFRDVPNCVYKELMVLSSQYRNSLFSILEDENWERIDLLKEKKKKFLQATDETLEKLRQIDELSLKKESKVSFDEEWCKKEAQALFSIYLPRRTNVMVIREYFITLAKLRLLKVALAARIYQLEDKKLPEDLKKTLSGILKEFPKDPFSGDFLRWVFSEKKLVIYSIGPDKRDDEGNIEYDKRTEKGDILIEFNI